ncbi:hypothetical protein [Oceanococcus atlanticus]|uniref:hypothetical protein n=1 Tax=Oceanococcus atlanticus TaxID=1317117 RepID=UPI001314E574|nr:hypothetical protein [Oceanococcus atlanticus]
MIVVVSRATPKYAAPNLRFDDIHPDPAKSRRQQQATPALSGTDARYTFLGIVIKLLRRLLIMRGFLRELWHAAMDRDGDAVESGWLPGRT